MEKKANEIKQRGLKKLKLGGGEKMQKAAYKLGDGYHANMPGSTPESDKKMYRYQESADRLAGTGIDLDPDKTTPTKMYSPIKKALVGDQNQLPEQLQQEILDSPTKFVSPGMTPMATGGGFKMQMGSKENFSGTWEQYFNLGKKTGKRGSDKGASRNSKEIQVLTSDNQRKYNKITF